MIIVALQNGKTYAMRGKALGIWRRILMALHQPIQFQAFEDEDYYEYLPGALSYFQTLDDQVALDRRNSKKQERETAGPRMVQIPGMKIPSQRN